MEILGKRKEFSMNKKIIIALILIIIASIVTTFAIVIYNFKSVENEKGRSSECNCWLLNVK